MTKKHRANKQDEGKKSASAEADAQGRRPKLKRNKYEKELEKLQIELVKLQEWVKHSGARVVVVFEGRDAAGKGGVIKRITERVSPRVFRVVALPAPSDREKQHHHLPCSSSRLFAHAPRVGIAGSCSAAANPPLLYATAHPQGY